MHSGLTWQNDPPKSGRVEVGGLEFPRGRKYMWIDWGLRTCSVRACSFISLHPHYESTTFSFAPCFTTTDQTLSLPPTHPSSYDSSTLPTLATHLLTDPSLIATPHPQQLLDLASMKRYPCLPKRPNPPKSKNEKNERKSERENDTKSKRLQLFLPTTNVFLPRTNVFTPVKSYVKSPLSPIIIAQERAQLLAQQRKSPTRRRPYRVVLYIKLKFIVKEWEMMSMGPPATGLGKMVLGGDGGSGQLDELKVGS